MGIFNMIYETV